MSYTLYRGENLNNAIVVAENIRNKEELFSTIAENL